MKISLQTIKILQINILKPASCSRLEGAQEVLFGNVLQAARRSCFDIQCGRMAASFEKWDQSVENFIRGQIGSVEGVGETLCCHSGPGSR